MDDRVVPLGWYRYRAQVRARRTVTSIIGGTGGVGLR